MIHVHPVQCRYNQRTTLRQLDVGNICLAQHARPMGRITIAFHLLGLAVILEQPPIGTYPQPVAVRLHTGYPPVFRIRLQAVGQRRDLKPMFSFLLQHTNPIVQSGTNFLSDAFYSSHWRLAKLFQTIISTDIPFFVQLDAPHIVVTRNPHVARLVFIYPMDVPTGQRFQLFFGIGKQLLLGIRIQIDNFQSAFRPYPQPFEAVLTQRMHEVILQSQRSRLRMNGRHPIAVITPNTVVRGHPNKPVGIADDVVHKAMGHSCRFGDIIKIVLTEKTVLTLRKKDLPTKQQDKRKKQQS